jgi:hypothetical protein
MAKGGPSSPMVELASDQKPNFPNYPSDLADSVMFKGLAMDASSSMDTSYDGADLSTDENKIQLMKAKLV